MARISYELQKELKASGFPGSKDWFDYGDFLAPGIGDGPEIVPTLSELIEACGVEFPICFCLNQEYMNGVTSWHASVEYPRVVATDGKTLEEAVARLWLSLNKKNG